MPKEEKRKTWKEVQHERQMKQQLVEEAHLKLTKSNTKRKHKLPKGTMVFAIVLAALLLSASAYGIWQYYEGQKPPEIGGGSNVVPTANLNAPAPDFSLRDINGTRVSLSQFKGRVIGIHFMAVGCHGQIYEVNEYMLSELRRLCNSYCGNGSITFLTVAVATCENSQLDQLRGNYRANWILGNDYDDEVLDIVDAYAPYEIYDGSVVLIDETFNITQVYTPGASGETLASRVRQMLQVG